MQPLSAESPSLVIVLGAARKSIESVRKVYAAKPFCTLPIASQHLSHIRAHAQRVFERSARMADSSAWATPGFLVLRTINETF